jgi:hypothetical protein
MKYVQTIWRLNSARSTADRESWLGSLAATIETEFPISCCFVLRPEQHQQVLNWIQAKAVGPYSVEELPDGRIAVVLGDRHDAVRLRAFHWHCLDHSVIVANRSAEQICGFFGLLKSRRAS